MLVRRLLLALMLVVCSSPVFARAKLQGWCEQGGVSVAVPGTSGSGSQKFQQSYPSCTITFYAAGTTNLISIYSDNAGTPKANPFTAATNSLWFAYLDNQRVDVKFSGTGITAPFTLSDFLVDDNAQLTTTLNALVYSATPTFDASLYSLFTMTLTGNVTSSTITNSVTGQLLAFDLCQDGTGGRTFAWPASFLRPPVIASGPLQCTNPMFFYDGTNWRPLAASGDNAQLRAQNGNIYVDQVAGNFGAASNTAYTGLPTGSVSRLFFGPSMTGSCPDFSTPLTLSTTNKQVLYDFGGNCPNYTPTTATSAITTNFGPASGNYYLGQGLINGNLTNGTCQTNGGCGSSATGLTLGNSPSIGNLLDNLSISGFGTGINALGGGANSWGVEASNLTLAWNTTGITLAGPFENFSLGGRVISNGTGINIGVNVDVYCKGSLSLDSNLTVGVQNAGNFFCPQTHAENSNGLGGGVTTHYINQPSGGQTVIGGLWLDDNPTGNTDWWINCAGGSIVLDNPVFFSNGRTATSVINATAPCNVSGSYVNASPSVLTNFLVGTGTNNLIGAQDANQSNTETSLKTTAGDIHKFNANASVSGAWGISVTGAGAAQDIYLRLGTPVLAQNSNAFSFQASLGGALWGKFNANGLVLGSAATMGIDMPETTCPSTAAAHDILCANAVNHRAEFSNNNGAYDFIVGRATTDIFTNKTFDSAGTGNALEINGVQITAGVTAIPAALATTAATSDNVSIQGVTASSHCTLTATNASAATNIATTYISSKTTNQITVTHTATGSMNYDILCTQN